MSNVGGRFGGSFGSISVGGEVRGVEVLADESGVGADGILGFACGIAQAEQGRELTVIVLNCRARRKFVVLGDELVFDGVAEVVMESDNEVDVPGVGIVGEVSNEFEKPRKESVDGDGR